MLQQNTSDRVAYEQWKFLSQSPRGQRLRAGYWQGWVPGRALLWVADCSFLVGSSRGREGESFPGPLPLGPPSHSRGLPPNPTRMTRHTLHDTLLFPSVGRVPAGKVADKGSRDGREGLSCPLPPRPQPALILPMRHPGSPGPCPHPCSLPPLLCRSFSGSILPRGHPPFCVPCPCGPPNLLHLN